MITPELLKELELSGYKYTKDNIVFITKDKTGQLVWLEKGNANAGLLHIIKNHAEDFAKSHGLKETEISQFLYNIITNGSVISNKPSKYANGFDRVYDYEGDYYIFSGLGSNGFIVTAFPVNK